MTNHAHTLPHDSAYLSVAQDGDVMVVTDMLGFVANEEIVVALDDGRMTLTQSGRIFLDVPLDEERIRDVELAGAVLVTETSEGTEPSEDGFVVHAKVRKAA